MADLKPANITIDRTRRVLVIDWNDGHHSEYDLAMLREACPCAECRGGHANMGTVPDPNSLIIPLAPAKSHTVRDARLVGHYALQIEWEDGHVFGIYTWDYLRALCTCAECTAERERESAGED